MGSSGRREGQVFTSPIDEGGPDADIAYIGRLHYRGRNLLIIAGVHALGSVGAVDYLTEHFAVVFAEVGDSSRRPSYESGLDATHQALLRELQQREALSRNQDDTHWIAGDDAASARHRLLDDCPSARYSR